MSKPFRIRDRVRSFRWAWRGLCLAARHEHNLWIHLVAFAIVLVAGFFLHLSRMEWVAVLLASGLVVSAEIMNTALEKLTDLVSPEWNERAGTIKDLAAASVLIAAMVAVAVGAIIVIPKLLNWPL